MFDNDRGWVSGRKEDLYKGFKVQNFRALKILIQLLDENEGSTDPFIVWTRKNQRLREPQNHGKFKAKSQKCPNLQTCPAV